ncbi:MAG: acetyl-CoA carboxylase biotin carboxyl carrier protein subunit, partial [Oscillospiraceae bacterium]|nr:acetyl-CoA carboxylase biotin carboxyl carrier protein subunit [Oscillospiraceae bacterium]
MKHRVTLNDRVYEVEVEIVEPIKMQEYMAYAPAAPAPAPAAAPVAAPAAAPAAEVAVSGDGERVDS